MTNEILRKTLITAIEQANNAGPSKDIELTDDDLNDVAGGACAGYCGTFNTMNGTTSQAQ